MNGDVSTARRMPPGSVASEVSPWRRQMLRGMALTRVLKSSIVASIRAMRE